MSIVQMKTVSVTWSQTVYYKTTMEVPVEFTKPDIEDAFWFLDLSSEDPIDVDGAQIDYVESGE